MDSVRIESDAWCEPRNDWDQESQTSYGESNFRARIRVDSQRWSTATLPDVTNTVLKNTDGDVITPIRGWYQEDWNNEQWYANYQIDDTNGGLDGNFKLILDEHINDFYIDVGEYDGDFYCNDVEDGWHETDGTNEIDTPEEIFELIPPYNFIEGGPARTSVPYKESFKNANEYFE